MTARPRAEASTDHGRRQLRRTLLLPLLLPPCLRLEHELLRSFGLLPHPSRSLEAPTSDRMVPRPLLLLAILGVAISAVPPVVVAAKATDLDDSRAAARAARAAVPIPGVRRHLSRRRRDLSSSPHSPAIASRQVQHPREALERWEQRDEVELARRATPSNTPAVCKGTVTAYSQCGGQNWAQDTCCVAGFSCVYSNEYCASVPPEVLGGNERVLTKRTFRLAMPASRVLVDPFVFFEHEQRCGADPDGGCLWPVRRHRLYTRALPERLHLRDDERLLLAVRASGGRHTLIVVVHCVDHEHVACAHTDGRGVWSVRRPRCGAAALPVGLLLRPDQHVLLPVLAVAVVLSRGVGVGVEGLVELQLEQRGGTPPDGDRLRAVRRQRRLARIVPGRVVLRHVKRLLLPVPAPVALRPFLHLHLVSFAAVIELGSGSPRLVVVQGVVRWPEHPECPLIHSAGHPDGVEQGLVVEHGHLPGRTPDGGDVRPVWRSRGVAVFVSVGLVLRGRQRLLLAVPASLGVDLGTLDGPNDDGNVLLDGDALCLVGTLDSGELDSVCAVVFRLGQHVPYLERLGAV